MKLTQNNLLVILGLIIFVKFVLVPVIEWQDEAVLQLSALHKRLNKSESFINELPKLTSEKEKLASYLNQLKSNVDTYSNISNYQIGKQKDIETLFKQNSLTIKSFNWQDTIETDKGSQLKLMIQYSGMLKDFLSLHLQMSKFNQSVEVTNLGLNIRGQDEASMGIITGSIVFVFTPFKEATNDSA